MSIITFGYKHGALPPADLVVDVRDLPNPHNDRVLKRLDGTHFLVTSWVAAHGGERRAREIVEMIKDLPRDSVIAIGCTGGRHRSVVIARLVGSLTGELVEHRDFTPILHA